MPIVYPGLTHQIAGNTSGATANISTGTYVLAGGNNITLSQAGNNVTISGAAGGGAGDGGNILAAGTRTAGSNSSVLFSNINGISFGLDTVNGSIMTASYTVPTLTNSTMSVSDALTSGTLARLAFTNLNGVTLSLSTGAGGSHTIVGSHNGVTSQSNQNVTAANGGFAFQTLSFSNTQGVSFATSAGSAIVGSVETSYAASNHSHGNPTLALTNLSGTTASESNGFTLSLAAAAPGGGFTRSRFNPWMEAVAMASTLGQGTLQFHPIPDPEAFQFDRLAFDVSVNQTVTATNTSGSATVSLWAGIYSRNVSTLSLIASSSTSLGLSSPGTGSSSLYQGARIMTMGWTTTIAQNDLWMGIVSRTTTGGVNKYAAISQYMASDITEAYSGVLGLANNASAQNVLGLGIYSASTAGIPGSVAFSQLVGTSAGFQRIPLYYFISQTA